ncbi:alpha/beta fold hydrolase [Mycobacterium sp. B14F4]|uniref:alpha/beta fold hydrolase n=1 Tax=Mycobacterium sp. B14F4 TaxID=3153565 RepID=UPI00325DF392
MGVSRDEMLAGAAVAVRTVELAGTTTSVLEAGQGPPMVLLHGAIECGGALWVPAVTELAKNHRLIIPDFPGLGESSPLAEIDIDSFSAWLHGMFERLDVARATLVAHSMLGGMAARFASRDGSGLARLVLYAAPAVGRYRMPVGLRYRAVRFAVRPTAANLRRFQQFALLDLDATRARDPAWFDAFSAYTLDRARQPQVKATMTKLVSTQGKAVALAGIRVPTALLWGREDRMVPLRIAEPTADRYGWPLFIVDRAGHVPHIEQPAAFVETLEAICRAA